MKKKFASIIITSVFDSMYNDDRLREDEKALLERIISDIFYDGKIRIKHYLENYEDCFEKEVLKDE